MASVCLVPVLAAGLAVPACRTAPSTVTDEAPASVLARLERVGRAVDASLGGGAVRYLGFEAWPEGALPGDSVTVVHWWYAARPLDRPYRVFVHSLVQGARHWVPHGDHDPVPPSDRWPEGKVIRDEHRIELPHELPGDAIELWVGLYSGERRLAVDRVEQHDGSHAIRAGGIRVGGTPVPRPEYRAPRLSRAPAIDGVSNDAEWGGAPWIDGFQLASGAGKAAIHTRARLAWDDRHLYLEMQTADPDAIATMRARDEPIYREEALEIFIDADADRSSYSELQVNQLNTQFDASFAGGPRRNMRVDWNARYVTAVKTADARWTAEWAIDVESLPDAEPLEEGARWRINLFRIAKDRVGGAMQHDESAWSPPLMGDFHNLERFGDLWFVR